MIDFPSVSKADWLRQIAADLKDRPLEEFRWVAPDGTEVSPFVHADDFERLPPPIYGGNNHWELAEEVAVGDCFEANRLIVSSLEGGAEGISLVFNTTPTVPDMAALFDGVYLDFIGLHFEGEAVGQNPAAFLGLLEITAKAKGLTGQNLRGSVAYNPATVAAQVDWRYLAEAFEYAQVHFPAFQLLRVPADSPADALKTANIYMEKLSAKGVPVQVVADSIQFGATVGKSYFWEIARLRAFQVLWFNFLQAWGLPLKRPYIAARFDPGAYTDELYTNMIRATTMAMSAALGGASRLTVLPYDAGREEMATYPASFGRRMARNVQHLLRMESGLDEVPDPAAGSYYVETLTRQIAERAWAAFSQV